MADRSVWVREQGEEVVVVRADTARGPVEVARHLLSLHARQPAHRRGALPALSVWGALAQAVSQGPRGEEAFLAIGKGAKLWLVEAAAAGAHKIRPKMERARQLAKKLYGKKAVSEALESAARSGRFAEEDLVCILAYQRSHPRPREEVEETERILEGSESERLRPAHGPNSRRDGPSLWALLHMAKSGDLPANFVFDAGYDDPVQLQQGLEGCCAQLLLVRLRGGRCFYAAPVEPPPGDRSPTPPWREVRV